MGAGLPPLGSSRSRVGTGSPGGAPAACGLREPAAPSAGEEAAGTPAVGGRRLEWGAGAKGGLRRERPERDASSIRLAGGPAWVALGEGPPEGVGHQWPTAGGVPPGRGGLAAVGGVPGKGQQRRPDSLSIVCTFRSIRRSSRGAGEGPLGFLTLNLPLRHVSPHPGAGVWVWRC